MKTYKILWYLSVPFLVLLSFAIRFLLDYTNLYISSGALYFIRMIPTFLQVVMVVYFTALALNFYKIVHVPMVRRYAGIVFIIFALFWLDYFFVLFSFSALLWGFLFSNNALLYLTGFSAYYGTAFIYSLLKSKENK